MKAIKIVGAIAVIAFSVSACKDQREARVLSLTSGEQVYVVEDENGIMVNRDTKQPVLLYVEDGSKDTVYGPTGKVVNGRLLAGLSISKSIRGCLVLLTKQPRIIQPDSFLFTLPCALQRVLLPWCPENPKLRSCISAYHRPIVVL